MHSGDGPCQQHRRAHREDERASTVVLDYFYLNEEHKVRPHLVAQFKNDGEHSLVKMKKAAGQDAKNLTKVICEESPAGDSKVNNLSFGACMLVSLQAAAGCCCQMLMAVCDFECGCWCHVSHKYLGSMLGELWF